MKTLHTLKDIDSIGQNAIVYFVEEDLKEVAKEWLKELKKGDYLTINNGLPCTDSKHLEFTNVDKKALCLWIKHFFNLGEEE